MTKPIPIIDLFAGPGGLAEGFSSFRVDGRAPFRVSLSIEKDARAHETLTLRGFCRQFDGGPPPEYWQLLEGSIPKHALFERYPEQYARAAHECVQHELGLSSDRVTYDLVRDALKGHDTEWGLIGGPPCQAYSTIGRSRNRGIADYIPEQDHRQTLYLEYLQIISDHRPAFFVMENVKGLLSATLDSERLFGRILEDLQNPSAALRRVGRRAAKVGARYKVCSLTRPSSGLFGPSPSDLIVRAEEFGIPQARHRVILLGVLEDSANEKLSQLKPMRALNVSQALRGLPRLRSGITDGADDDENWSQVISAMGKRSWVREMPIDLRTAVKDAASQVTAPKAGRGGEFLRGRKIADRSCPPVLNHATRGHITADLERYFFAACFADARGRSPTLSDFPESLLPKHSSAKAALGGGNFADRFRVQLAARVSTTITSHISKDGHYYIHPDPTQCRSLTVREAARLQTFNDDYFFCGPRTAQFHQVGNAVPPALARQIAEVAHRLI